MQSPESALYIIRNYVPELCRYPSLKLELLKSRDAKIHCIRGVVFKLSTKYMYMIKMRWAKAS